MPGADDSSKTTGAANQLHAVLAAWRSGPPAPSLAELITDEVRSDENRLVALLRADLLERRRVRGLPAWADEDLPISIEHYESVLGHAIEPGTLLAAMLVQAGLELAGEVGEDALQHALDRLDQRFPDEVARFVQEAGSDGGLSLHMSLAPGADDSSALMNLPDRIGNYRLFDLANPLGSGGMGIVYRAEQLTPDGQVLRAVALKIIRPGVATPAMLRRFEHEAATLAKLQHPGIATIYEAGTFDVGAGAQPFFAMELVEGVPLTTYAKQQNLGTRERLKMISRICEAVQHAHQKGVIHRDLKPANILISPQGGPKVLDFGVARATDSDLQTTTLRTDIGQLIGTIPYMSPEQASGESDDLDTRSDVYALGVMAYELLAGRLPYNVPGRLIHEAVRIIREEEPTRLSSINRALRGDVEIIVGKALEKEPQRRYQSASDLASDIERYLNDEPIVARPPSAAYQLRKFARRNQSLVVGFASVMIVLVAGLIGVSIMYLRAEDARMQQAKLREEAEASEARAVQAAQFAAVAEADARRRERELLQVAAFQETQLTRLEIPLIGRRVRDELLDQWRASNSPQSPDDVAFSARLDQLQRELDSVNFATVAMEVFSDDFFDSSLSAIDDQFADQPLVKAHLLHAVSRVLHAHGLLDRALATGEQATKLRRAHVGDQHVDTLASIHDLGVMLMKLEHYEAAQFALDEAYRGRRATLGENHAETLNTVYELANLARATNDEELAHDRFSDVLDRRIETLGRDHVDTYVAMAGLASAKWYANDHQQAESLLQDAVEGLRRVRGELDINTLAATNNLALLRILLGRSSEAEELLQQILHTLRQDKGDAHPYTLMVLANIGVMMQYREEYEAAVRYNRQVLEARLRLYGANHSETNDAMRNLVVALHYVGYDLRNSGRLEDAVNAWQESLELYHNFHSDPDYHEQLALAEGVLRQGRAEYGRQLTEAGRFAEAEAQLLKAYSMYLAALGPDNKETQAVGEWGIDLYDAWHQHEPDAGHDATAAMWRERTATPDSQE
jgi:eukaryotic-like serine/threonine-protein kinase